MDPNLEKCGELGQKPLRVARSWRNELIGDLGGDATLSTQQRALVDLVVRTKLMPDSIDAWLLTATTLGREIVGRLKRTSADDRTLSPSRFTGQAPTTRLEECP